MMWPGGTGLLGLSLCEALSAVPSVLDGPLLDGRRSASLGSEASRMPDSGRPELLRPYAEAGRRAALGERECRLPTSTTERSADAARLIMCDNCARW